MKKILLFVVLLASSLMIFAKDSKIVLTSGSLDFLKDAGQYAYLEVNWTNANVVEFDTDLTVEKDFGTIDQYNEMQGADWVKDWDRVRKEANLTLPLIEMYGYRWFPGKKKCFNNKNKNGLLFTVNPEWYTLYNEVVDSDEKEDMEESITLVDPATAKYKVIVIVDTVDMGNGAAAAFGAGGAIMKGRIQVLNLQDNSTVAEMEFNHVKGYGHYMQFIRLQSVIHEIFLGELLPLLKNN